MSRGKSQQHQSSILHVATQEFAKNGFKGTTLKTIAECASLPKANVLYYFKNKEQLYISVLEQILNLWNSSFDKATVDDCPKVVLSNYIEEKMRLAQTEPEASKIFALEMINGAPILMPYLQTKQKTWFDERIKVIQGWIEAGKITPIEPRFLMFSIWASCQHYADFSTQIKCLMGHDMNEDQFTLAIQTVKNLVLAGCGLNNSLNDVNNKRGSP